MVQSTDCNPAFAKFRENDFGIVIFINDWHPFFPRSTRQNLELGDFLWLGNTVHACDNFNTEGLPSSIRNSSKDR
jgi:hypothetical protein